VKKVDDEAECVVAGYYPILWVSEFGGF